MDEIFHPEMRHEDPPPGENSTLEKAKQMGTTVPLPPCLPKLPGPPSEPVTARNAPVPTSGILFPADPRALVQYLLQQTRETTPTVNETAGSETVPRVPSNGDFSSSAMASLHRLIERPPALPGISSAVAPAAVHQTTEAESDSSAESPAPDSPGGPAGTHSPTMAATGNAGVDVNHLKQMKLQRQNHVIELVKTALKPHYAAGKITKAEYKEIMRKAVPKICHSKSGNVETSRIQSYIDVYVTRVIQSRKHTANLKHHQPDKQQHKGQHHHHHHGRAE
jgi:hypothetical protein